MCSLKNSVLEVMGCNLGLFVGEDSIYLSQVNPTGPSPLLPERITILLLVQRSLRLCCCVLGHNAVVGGETRKVIINRRGCRGWPKI